MQELVQLNPKLKRDILEKWNENTLGEYRAEVAVVEVVIGLKVEKEKPELKEKLLYWLQRERGPKQKVSRMNALTKRLPKQV